MLKAPKFTQSGPIEQKSYGIIVAENTLLMRDPKRIAILAEANR